MHEDARSRTPVSQVIIYERLTGLEGIAFERIRGHAIPEQSITRSITKRFENRQKSAKVALHFCFIFAFEPRRIGNPPGRNAWVAHFLIASSISPKGRRYPNSALRHYEPGRVASGSAPALASPKIARRGLLESRSGSGRRFLRRGYCSHRCRRRRRSRRRQPSSARSRSAG